MRVYRKAADLTQIRNRCNTIKPQDILLFATVKDEYIRLPYFLDYYRKIGIGHFLIVDNNSLDGGRRFLANQQDVSLWSTKKSYKSARFGIDWMHGLLNRFGNGHWCLTVDPDELLIYPHLNTRPLCALTAWLDQQGQRSFPALLLDLFPKGSVAKAQYKLGQNPLISADILTQGIIKSPKITVIKTFGLRAARGHGISSTSCLIKARP